VDTINVESLQPWQWIQRHEAHVGGYAPLPVDTHEIGVPEDLLGKVLDILPCPPMRAGPGRVVLTTVNHLNTDVVELTLRDSRGETETLRPTAIHLFYSTSHGEWIPASRLANGERLDGVDGKVTVVDVTRLPGTHRVYNMTVQGEHLYRVAECGVLVHNQYGDEATNIVSEISIAGSGRKINVGAPKEAVDMHHSIPRGIQRRLREAGNAAADSRDVIGRAGLPNRMPVERGLHRQIHSGKGYVGKGTDGVGGGHYNNAFDRLIKGQGGYENVTPAQLVEMRDFLVRWFDL
nr:hypothetical protein [Planctomycetota bacterium]